MGGEGMVELWPTYETKMRAEGLNDAAIDAFKHNFGALLSGVNPMIPESSIEPVQSVPTYESLPGDEQPALLSKTLMLKLNGGLGTSMGLNKAKSLLPVVSGDSFLDLIAKQIHATENKLGSNVKFMLMNSFSTSDDTMSALAQYPNLAAGGDLEFIQNKAPKVVASDYTPASWPQDPQLE